MPVWPKNPTTSINNALAGPPGVPNQYGGRTIDGIPYGAPGGNYQNGMGNTLQAIANSMFGSEFHTPGWNFPWSSGPPRGAYPPPDSGAWVYEP